MSALSSADLATLRAGLSAGLNRQTLSVQQLTGGIWSADGVMSAIVTSDAKTSDRAPDGKVWVTRRITVRQLADTPVMKIGDRISYDGVTFLVDTLAGTDVRTITALHKTNNGIGTKDRPRAEGDQS